jgi:hypothetical protein
MPLSFVSPLGLSILPRTLEGVRSEGGSKVSVSALDAGFPVCCLLFLAFIFVKTQKSTKPFTVPYILITSIVYLRKQQAYQASWGGSLWKASSAITFEGYSSFAWGAAPSYSFTTPSAVPALVHINRSNDSLARFGSRGKSIRWDSRTEIRSGQGHGCRRTHITDMRS